jgi:hypothetical protein
MASDSTSFFHIIFFLASIEHNPVLTLSLFATDDIIASIVADWKATMQHCS